MKTILTTEALTALRTFGDPPLQKVLKAKRTLETPEQKEETAKRTFETVRRWSDLLPATVSPDPEKLVVAQRLYRTYTSEIYGALLLAALPQSYATEYGAGVLGAHGNLQTDLTRRIGRTAQFLITVLQQGKDNARDQKRLWDWQSSKDSADVHDLPWAACLRLRVFHQIVRNDLAVASRNNTAVKDLLITTQNKTPLNQEDLLGMLLMFSFVVFEVLERYGITWSADEQEAYLHLWDVVGGYLGIGSDAVVTALKPVFEVPRDWVGLRPPTTDESRCLVQQIRDRQWIDPSTEANLSAMSWTALRAGRVLTRALLDELQEGMPPLLKPLPIAVMRTLNPKVVRSRLNLGGNGVFLQLLSQMPKKRVTVDAFTSMETPNRFAGRVLRALANDVTARASVHLLEKFQLHMPGAPDWEFVPSYVNARGAR